MLSYLLRRLVLMVPTLIGVTLVVFFVMAMAPGGFGAALDSQTGEEAVGEESRLQKQYMMRRYRLDRPLMVQYGYWLNQVSPIGFQTTDKVYAGDEEARENEARKALSEFFEANPWLRDTQTEQLTRMADQIAAYQQVPIPEVATELTAAIEDPEGQGLAMLDGLGGTDEDREIARKPVLNAANEAEQRDALIKSMAFQSGGLNRVLFTRPTVKVPDLGLSTKEQRVSRLVLPSLKITLLLNLITFPLIYIIAILIGVYAARHRGGAFDIASGSVMLGFWSFPRIGAGVLLLALLASKQYVHWFPTGGLSSLEAESMAFLPSAAGFWQATGFTLHVVICSLALIGAILLVGMLIGQSPRLLRGETGARGTLLPLAAVLSLIAVGVIEFRWNPSHLPTVMPDDRGWLIDRLWHLVLPVLCLMYTGFAVLSKLVRGSVLDNLSADYARTARAKGVREQDILFRHVFRNSLLPLITVAATIIPAMIVGSVVVERIFTIKGMGFLAVEAAFQKDRELILATTLFAGLLGLTSELLRDLCYAFADPRVSYE